MCVWAVFAAVAAPATIPRAPAIAATTVELIAGEDVTLTATVRVGLCAWAVFAVVVVSAMILVATPIILAIVPAHVTVAEVTVAEVAVVVDHVTSTDVTGGVTN
jgi:hypothetical protein